MKGPPLEDPGVGNQPIGILALAAAAVRSISTTLVVRSDLLLCRSNEHIRCTLLVTLLLPPNSSIPATGVQ